MSENPKVSVGQWSAQKTQPINFPTVVVVHCTNIDNVPNLTGGFQNVPFNELFEACNGYETIL